MALNFNDIANKKLEDIERPPLPPVGTYRVQVMKVPEVRENISDGAYDVVDFMLRPLEAMDDVDPDALATFGNIQSAVIPLSFMFDKSDATRFAQTEFKLRTFLAEHLALGAGVSIKEGLAQSLNAQCLATISWRPDKSDSNIQYVNVKRTAPIE